MNSETHALHAPQLRAAEETLTAVLAMTHPADSVLHRYFRASPQLGRTDRAFVAEAVFGVLRQRYGLEAMIADTAGAPGRPARGLLLAWLQRTRGLSVRALQPVLKEGEAAWLAALPRTPVEDLPLSVRAELPPWTVDELAAQGWSTDEILALGRASAKSAPLDLRVNSLVTTREAVLAQFAAEGLQAVPTPYAPYGIRLVDKPALNKHALFLQGAIEVQDEGSQLLAHLVAPKRREMVADFCAGAGGKTLLLGALMHTTGRLYAFDVSERRLAELTPRLRRSGLSNVHPQRISHENDTRIKRLGGKIDRVLVDAPCSGFGTLRRNPDLKWRQSEAGVGELAAKQRRILDAAAGLLKPGGRLVYATCSVFTRENGAVVSGFMDDHPEFTLLPTREELARQGIVLNDADGGADDSHGAMLQLTPQRHGCDGFFAAVLQRAP